MASDTVRGTLHVHIEEAGGKTQLGGKDVSVWDSAATAHLSVTGAFVKIELRGGSRNTKAQTNRMPLIGDTITWREDLKLDVLDNSNELRILLCRDKNTGTKKGTSVIAACGIFVNEIIDAVPIDKYFEMFKPNQGGEGGFIRIGLDFSPAGSAQPAGMRSIFEESGSGARAAPNLVSRQPAKKKRMLLPVLLSVGLSVAAAGTAVVVRALKKR